MTRLRYGSAALAFLLCAANAQTPSVSGKPLITLDEFFNSVEFANVRISPDGRAVVIETTRADWEANRFRSDLWLFREDGSMLTPLTTSGHDSEPEWSPDGNWIAFLSDRNPAGETPADADGAKEKAEKTSQVYVISTHGGEAFAVTRGEEDVHAFAWSTDSRQIYFATRTHREKEQEETYKKEWKDVVQFREEERGDVINRVDVAQGLSCAAAKDTRPCEASTGARQMAAIQLRVKQLEMSPDGKRLAVLTDSRTQRWETLDAYGIYLMDPNGGQPQKLLQKEAVLDDIRWAADSRHIFFSFLNGSVDGAYHDAQSRVYWVDASEGAGAIARWCSKFPGALTGFAPMPNGGLVATGRTGTEVQVYAGASPSADFARQPGVAGTYEKVSTAAKSPRVAFVHSSLQRPAEVYVAESVGDLVQAKPITAFNRLFTERALPQGKPYRWTADDGVTVEGMLIYPPGKFDAKNLRLLTLIHGGPGDADGNHFQADWYQWGQLAATQGWLVFQPNYRGSIGYGDEFTLGIVPKIVSKPGRDILAGIDALVKDGIADPAQLTIGGYSYGGYMTNWLITQTTRFKAAVTGAGAVEHVANWGNDDTTYDDAYFLGGKPWEARQNYNDEAAIWQMDKVKTPTHIVGGADDVRVYVGEDYLLERALHTQGIPVKLLIFPGEGHELDKNPWHGKIKVREELKWLAKYGQ
jgi:dipeptidyl aminopeptidase/acylaminoacyl peptidase